MPTAPLEHPHDTHAGTHVRDASVNADAAPVNAQAAARPLDVEEIDAAIGACARALSFAYFGTRDGMRDSLRTAIRHLGEPVPEGRALRCDWRAVQREVIRALSRLDCARDCPGAAREVRDAISALRRAHALCTEAP